MQHNNRSFRGQLVAAFSAEELASFCFDHYPDVYHEFTPAMEQSQRVRLLLDYCLQQQCLPELYELLNHQRPGLVVSPEETTRELTRARTKADRNRAVMLDKVEDFWVRGVLEQSLYVVARIDLGLASDPDAIVNPWASIIQRPGQLHTALPPGMPIAQVFDELYGSMLILGSPGAGKTTLLLELTRGLIARARDDEQHPIPVVFNLSSWASERKPLKEWLVDELSQRYQVPRKVGVAWLEGDHLLALLDGLDEVAVECRDACVEAINAFHEDSATSPVVCCRVADYQALVCKLWVTNALVVQPLDEHQVDEYLVRLGEPVAHIRAMLRDDPALLELLETPLMLAVMVLTYQGQPAKVLRSDGAVSERRREVWDAYIERMFTRRGVCEQYPHERVQGYLSWLAWQMREHDQTTYYVEGMQPSWLPSHQRWITTWSAAIACTVAGMLAGSVVGVVVDGLAGSVFGGLAFGLMQGIIGGYSRTIQSVEVLRWSWETVRARAVEWSRRGLVIGLTLGLILGLVSLLDSPEGFILILVLLTVCGLAFGVAFGAVGGFVGDEIELKMQPNQGIRQSGRNALRGGLVVGGVTSFVSALTSVVVLTLAWVLVGVSTARSTDEFVLALYVGFVFGGGFGLVLGPTAGLITGLIGVLRYGGRAVVQHYTLRWLLARSECLPWNPIPMFDYAVDRILLRRVGGGWIFTHRLLLEHFADRYEEQ